jgi:peptidoglycan/LPS O-acetylase OafA/YrhL
MMDLALNALLVYSYASQASIDAVNWTLVVEELFYVVAALLAWRGWLLSRSALLAVPIVLTVLAVKIWQYDPILLGALSVSPAAVASNATFVVYIFIGSALHCAYRRIIGRGVASLLVASLFILFILCLQFGPLARLPRNEFGPSHALALVLFTAAIALGDRLPRWRALDLLANISYPMYVLHALPGYLIIDAVYGVSGSALLAVAAALGAVVPGSYVVHRLVEGPLNRLGHRLAARIEPPIAVELLPAPAS